MRTGKSGRLDGLSVMRMLFLSFISALFLFLIVLLVIVRGERPDPVPAWMAVAFPLLLLACLGGVVWARSRPLEIADEASLAGSYRTLFFLGVAYAESAALVGFVGVFLVARLAPYLVGLAVGLIGLALIAPTRGDIQRRQQQITARGSTLSLGRALMGSTAR